MYFTHDIWRSNENGSAKLLNRLSLIAIKSKNLTEQQVAHVV